jgi:signal transduction histidine kinase
VAQTIHLSLKAEDGEATLRVSHEGGGIAAVNDVLRLPFGGLCGTSDEGFDGGLGLAVIRRVVELHGGRCWTEKVDGGGAAFAIGFPLLKPEPTVGAALPHTLSGK